MAAALTQARLKELLHYNPDTGEWTWLTKRSGVRAGSQAGWIARSPAPRRAFRISGKNYWASRLAFLYMTGEWPKALVDHRDCNPMNDRWDNLREATLSQNQGNKPGLLGRSLPKGVYRSGNKFRAQIGREGRNCSLGHFDTPEEASAAYLKAATEQFGEFARAA